MSELRDITHIVQRLAGNQGRGSGKANGRQPPPSGTGTPIDLDTLDDDTAELIEHGTENGEPSGNRSDDFHNKVVHRLRAAGHSFLDVLATLEAHPNGVQEKYAKRLRDEVWRSWGKQVPGQEFDLEDGPDTTSPESDATTGIEIDDPLPERPWPVMDPAAFHGIAGKLVREIAKTSETDPVGLLINCLVFAGNAIGRGAWWKVEATEHYPNLFALTIGQTARTRKGTTTNRIKAIFKIADPGWYQDCINEGELSSGEGFIDAVHDEVWGLNRAGERVKKREGVRDKRRLFIQSEFSGALRVMQRDGNILETVMCNAFDAKHVLETNTKQDNKVKATDVHISNLGHISIRVFLDAVTDSQIAGGFINRNLLVLMRRARKNPGGGDANAGLALAKLELEGMLSKARTAGEVTWTDQAKHEWEGHYHHLSRDRAGVLDEVLGRAEAQTLRLAMIFALLDGTTRADSGHLRAALAVWNYCEACGVWLFADRTGDPVADTILAELRKAPNGLSRTVISALFSRNMDVGRISAALTRLQRQRLAKRTKVQTKGRPSERWRAL